jgi:hypothetical protein
MPRNPYSVACVLRTGGPLKTLFIASMSVVGILQQFDTGQ